MVGAVNEGYVGGRVNRIQVASFILIRFLQELDAQVVKTIRVEFLDEITLLELCLKRSKIDGKLTPELKRLLMQQSGLLNDPVRKAVKTKTLGEDSQENEDNAA